LYEHAKSYKITYNSYSVLPGRPERITDNGNETECDCTPERSLKLRRLGEGACRTALERFHIQRFVADWNKVFAEATQ
jgi:hypothetical protein